MIVCVLAAQEEVCLCLDEALVVVCSPGRLLLWHFLFYKSEKNFRDEETKQNSFIYVKI